ncbi:MAG: glycoside hydrolase family 3 C-terminal domain-containing protein [Polyangiaceae bacterium]
MDSGDRKEHAFRNPELSTEERIGDLLSLLTLDEKIDCLGTDPSVPRLRIKASGHVEGLHGLALGGPGRWGGDCPVPTTTFPQAIGLAQTWNVEALREVATVESYEARYIFQNQRYARGGLVVRAPNADLGRDPRWGRTEECYGEDPYLAGAMAVSFVQGLQGDHPRYWRTAALLKHFLANSNENDRDRTSSDFDDRCFREYYSVPFRMAIQDGGSRAYMAAYNAYNGVPCTTHPVLAGVTVTEWKQDGIICTDAGALRLLVSAHRSHPDLVEAAAAAIHAGITQFLDDYRGSVLAAIERGLLGEAEIDDAIRRNFRVMVRLGLLDPPELVPYSSIGESDVEPWETPENRASVLRVTQESIVLLKHDRHLLPFDENELESVAVIGPLADRVLIDWYSGTPPYAVSPLEGIRRKVGSRVLVRQSTNNDVSDAVRLARQSDVCIVCVGNHPTGDAGWAEVARRSYGREAVDRQSLELEDEALVQRVWEANPRTALVLISSFPYCIGWSDANLPAIVHATHNSQELGIALADVLFGDYNPAGRLVQTWPRSIDQLPTMMNYDVRQGRTYMYFKDSPLYPFGHGLSYTTFAYRRMRIDVASIGPEEGTAVRVEVTNTGGLAGDEVIQMYVKHLESRVPRPWLALCGFRRVRFERGETKTVSMELRARDLAYWDTGRECFAVERGKIEILVGGSSANIALRGTVSIA